MARYKGKNGKVYLDGVKVGRITSYSADLHMQLEEGTECEATGEEYEGTIYGGDISFEGNFDDSDTAQAALTTDLLAGTSLTLELIHTGTRGSGSAKGITGEVILSDYQRKGAVKGFWTFSAKGKFSGTITDSATL